MSALRHDSIIDAGDPDYALVEGEAERVAKQAVRVIIYIMIFFFYLINWFFFSSGPNIKEFSP